MRNNRGPCSANTVIILAAISIASLMLYNQLNVSQKVSQKVSQRFSQRFSNSPIRRVPINMNTQYVKPYRQVGMMSNDNGNIIPLFGRRVHRGSDKWNYYTMSDGNRGVRIPINIGGKKCSDSLGCKELYEDDNLGIDGYSGNFKVNLYDLDKPRYIPII
jgi:hypothetical protein